MATLFKTLAETLEKVEGTKKRTQTTTTIAELLKTLEPDELEPAINMILGRPFPKYSQKTLDVSWTTLNTVLRRITKVDWNVFTEAFSNTGDIGNATKTLFENAKINKQTLLTQQTLTIAEVRNSFEAIAATTGSGSKERKERLIEVLFSQATPTEAKYLMKIFTGEMRTGFHEGLMAKKLDSPYTPGTRGKRWLKIKTVLEPLDLVITAAENGYGRRHGWLSDYYLAARDAETGKFLVLGKTFKGLTDKEIIDLTKRLKALAVSEERWRVIVLPKVVVEVAYNEIQRSPKYKSQMALRFARITRIRDDKAPEDADTIQRVREIYERQFRKKGRYKPSDTQ
jgi:ATP-dependent DNA ligase